MNHDLTEVFRQRAIGCTFKRPKIHYKNQIYLSVGAVAADAHQMMYW